jgi:hypothetical protein
VPDCDVFVSLALKGSPARQEDSTAKWLLQVTCEGWLRSCWTHTPAVSLLLDPRLPSTFGAPHPFTQINGKGVRSLDDVLAVATTIHDREYVRLTMQDVFSGVSQVSPCLCCGVAPVQ